MEVPVNRKLAVTSPSAYKELSRVLAHLPADKKKLFRL